MLLDIRSSVPGGCNTATPTNQTRSAIIPLRAQTTCNTLYNTLICIPRAADYLRAKPRKGKSAERKRKRVELALNENPARNSQLKIYIIRRRFIEERKNSKANGGGCKLRRNEGTKLRRSRSQEKRTGFGSHSDVARGWPEFHGDRVVQPRTCPSSNVAGTQPTRARSYYELQNNRRASRSRRCPRVAVST